MFDVSFLLILIIIVALIFDFTNGAHDCANAIATVVSTKVLTLAAHRRQIHTGELRHRLQAR